MWVDIDAVGGNLLGLSAGRLLSVGRCRFVIEVDIVEVVLVVIGVLMLGGLRRSGVILKGASRVHLKYFIKIKLLSQGSQRVL